MDRQKFLRSTETVFAQEMEGQPFTDQFYYEAPCLDVDRAVVSHKVLGFGASFTDAACFMFSKLSPEARAEVFSDLFSPDSLNLSIGRLNVGSSDYATKVYCYDDVPDDFSMEHFSVAHDEKWIIPMVKEAVAVNPDMFLFSSPWSPPAWMKTQHTMCGGYMRAKYLPAFADYMVKYVQAYRDHGIHIQALTMQNESDAEQGGRMPQSVLHPDFEMELVGHLMPPRLAAAGLDTKLWLYDHNYSRWARVLYMLSDPEVLKHTDCVAFHPYDGTPEMIRPVREQYPQMRFQLTEKGPNLRPDSKESSLLWWFRTISGALNNGSESFVGWNYALDENGCPNLGDFDCAGLVGIHSQTGAVTQSVQYHAFRHFAPYLKRGAEILHCPLNIPLGPNAGCLIARNPDGSHVAVMGNSGTDGWHSNIQIKYQGKYLKVHQPAGSVTTLCF